MSSSVSVRARTAAPFAVLVAAFAAAAILAFAVLLGFPVAAEAKEWRIERMDVVLDVQEKGDVLVEETVTFAFEGSYTFVGRVIPTGNLDGIDDIQVFQGGRQLPRGDAAGTYDYFYEGSDLVIQVNFALQDTSATWTFKYLAQGAIHFFDEGDELRWYVFDADTPVPIDRASATVRLPAAVPMEQMTTAVDTGFATPEAVTSPEPGVLFYQGSDFAPYTRFWLVAGFPKDVVKFTWTARRVAGYVLPRLGFMLPILTFLGMLVIWARRGRDDPAAVHASFVTEPPSGLRPAVAGALVDERVEVREVLATIVDLARRGYLEMTDESEGFWLFRKTSTTFKRLKPIRELKGFEKEVATAIFGGKEVVDISDLKDEFYKSLEPITKKIYEEVTALGYFDRNPKSTRTRWGVIGVLVLVAWIGLSFLLAMGDVPGWGWLFAGGLISGATVLGFSRFMPQRTSAGAAEQRKWEAFRNYLKDLTRYQDMQTARETFEMYLPYAIAFGVERSWVRRFEDLQLPAPTWYRPVIIAQNQPGPVWADTGGASTGLPSGIPGGGGVPSLDSISDGLFSSLNSMSSVLTSSPSGSGSRSGGFGGGFGGGFSGGGGGGGFRAG